MPDEEKILTRPFDGRQSYRHEGKIMSIVLFEGPSGTSALYVEGVLKKRGPHAEVMDCLHRFTNVEVYHDDCFDMGGRSDIDKNAAPGRTEGAGGGEAGARAGGRAPGVPWLARRGLPG